MEEFKSLGKKTVYTSEKVNVSLQKLKLPNGNQVEWDLIEFPDIDMAIPLTKQGTVLMVEEWRQGPQGIMTSFVGARRTDRQELVDLRRELKEELGVVNGNYRKLIRFSNGVRITGFHTVYLVTEFDLIKPDTDENEIIEKIELPVNGLYQKLVDKHIVTGATLIMARLVEDYVKAM